MKKNNSISTHIVFRNLFENPGEVEEVCELVIRNQHGKGFIGTEAETVQGLVLACHEMYAALKGMEDMAHSILADSAARVERGEDTPNVDRWVGIVQAIDKAERK